MRSNQELLTLGDRCGMAYTGINCLCQYPSLIKVVQVIRPSFNCCLAYLCVRYEMPALQPPETAPTFNVTGDQKHGNRDLQLTSEFKAMCIVITISIVEGQNKRCASIFPRWLTFVRRVKFFQCCLQVTDSIVAMQIEQM